MTARIRPESCHDMGLDYSRRGDRGDDRARHLPCVAAAISEGMKMQDDEPAAQRTVRVRILVATDRKGFWLAYGWAGETNPERIKEAMALDDVEPGEIYHWIEADVPLPTEAGPVIEGVVHAE